MVADNITEGNFGEEFNSEFATGDPKSAISYWYSTRLSNIILKTPLLIFGGQFANL